MDKRQGHTELRLQYILPSLLHKHGMTAAQLSRNAGVPKSVISDWLAGASPRHLPQVMRVAKSLGVSLEMLCFGLDESQRIMEGNRIRAVIEGEFVIVRRHPD